MLRTPTHIVELGHTHTTNTKATLTVTTISSSSSSSTSSSSSSSTNYFNKLQKHKQKQQKEKQKEAEKEKEKENIISETAAKKSKSSKKSKATLTTTTTALPNSGTKNYHENSSSVFTQCQLQPPAKATKTFFKALDTPPVPHNNLQQQPQQTTKSLLSSTAFAFMRSKKFKTQATNELNTELKEQERAREQRIKLTPTPTPQSPPATTIDEQQQQRLIETLTAPAALIALFNNNNNNQHHNNNETNHKSKLLVEADSARSSSSASEEEQQPNNKSPKKSSKTRRIQPLSRSGSGTNFTQTSATTISLIAAIAPSTGTTTTTTVMSPTSQAPTRTSLFDSCHRKIRLIGGGPVAFLGGLVAKARRKERDGDQNATDTKLYLEESVLERKLPEADLKALVDLPAGLDYNEWLASHTLALFEHVNLVYGTISEFCTPSGCTDMTGPGNRTYLWFDEKGKKTRVAAPQYIDYVMTFTQKTVSDETIFPTKYANEFPSSFESIARKILRLQFHVIAHLYAMHFREIALLGLHTHLNLTFAHLTALHRRFNLIDEKETDVLRDLEVALRLTDDSAASTTSGSTSTINTTASNAGGGGGVAGSQSHEQSIGMDAPHHDAAGKLKQQPHQHHQQHQQHLHDDAAVIDGDANSPPICTQPEAATKVNSCCLSSNGGGNLTTGILGDLTSSEFGDNNRYYTSAVPSSATAVGNDPATAAAAALAAATAALNSNNQGAGALVSSMNGGTGGANNHNNNNNHPHHHHAHHHHHHHNAHHHHYGHHPHLHPHTPNSGLIQCNAAGGAGVGVGMGAPGGAVASGASSNAANTSAATATAHTTAA